MRKPHTYNLNFNEYYKSTIMWIQKHQLRYIFEQEPKFETYRLEGKFFQNSPFLQYSRTVFCMCSLPFRLLVCSLKVAFFNKTQKVGCTDPTFCDILT